ncbi:hypothetical protein Tcan_13404 [Toxocara canis]|uniref:Uncharacterized protein n=1 Tax=Toxocara canis TaxID=6265 RepID=A0A0B2V4Y2_TOXCA|nr:hypothetical protein Tcan_13404 [Toxocara canis]
MEASYSGNEYSQGPVVQRCSNSKSFCLKTEGRIADDIWGLLKGCSSATIFEMFTLATCVSEGCHWSWSSDGNGYLQCCCFSDFCNLATTNSTIIALLTFVFMFSLFKIVSFI